MEVPWFSADAPDAGPTALVMASRFQLRSAWRSPAFLAHSMRLWWQARRSPGVLCVSLRANPLRGTFSTLSAWTDRKALHGYARADPHGEVMRKIRPWMRDSTFRFWDVPTADLPRDGRGAAALWAEADERLAAPVPK